MENVKIKETPVSTFDELFEVIKEAVIKCKDTQFFISDALFKRLLQENKGSIIWEEAVLNSFQYCDNVEKAVLFCVMNNNKIRTVQINYVSDCLGYVHLTYFASKGVLYHHYLKGMKIILIINTD